MEEKEENELFMPQGVKSKSQFVDGFGAEEIRKSLLTVAILEVLDVIYYLSSRNSTWALLVGMLIVVVSVSMHIKDPNTNSSIVDLVSRMIRFQKSQKYYPYVGLREWRF